MAGIRFIHTADLHLDTPFKGLSNLNETLASILKNATFQSFRNIIDRCLQEQVDFLLIAGDIFDSENQSLAAQLKFADELQRLSDQRIPTYFICGNHDPLSSWIEGLQLPDNVHRFGSSEVEKIIHYKGDKPLVDIHGISFQNKAVRNDLTQHYQIKNRTAPVSLALLHGTIGQPGPHENYAPFSIENISGKGFDYWALGHIHKRQIIRKEHPAVVYPGNPQGRDFGETGAKGCYLVETTADQEPQIKFISTQLIRFEEVAIDLTGEDAVNILPEKIEETITGLEDYNEHTSYIVRLTLHGRTPLHDYLNQGEEISQLLDYLNEDQLNQNPFRWIDSIELKTQPDIDLDQIKKGADFPAEILQTIETYENDPERFQQLIGRTETAFNSPQANRELKTLQEEEYKTMLEKAKWMLLEQLKNEQQ